MEGKTYTVFGYKGKQGTGQHSLGRRGSIHTLFLDAPRRSGEVYNLGGGKDNSCSILEAFEICESFSGKNKSSNTLMEIGLVITSATTAIFVKLNLTTLISESNKV